MPLQLERTSPTLITLTRSFAATPARVYAAHIEPEVVRNWLTGPEGWMMTRCEIDARPGGHFRYDWQAVDGSHSFHLTAEVLEIDPPHRMRHVERMFLPDRTPDNNVETRFEAEGEGTLMVMTMQVDSAETMEAMLASGMNDGMEQSYARLEADLLA